jgi:hypothetical protein
VARVARGDFAARAGVRGNERLPAGEAFADGPNSRPHPHIKNAWSGAADPAEPLPRQPAFGGHDIAAASEYASETGGDYYGSSQTQRGRRKPRHRVGDVQRPRHPGRPPDASAMAYIPARPLRRTPGPCRRTLNELVAEDTDRTGRFRTLFLLELTKGGAVRWVRAGHDPPWSTAGGRQVRGAPRLACPGVLRQADFALYERTACGGPDIVIARRHWERHHRRRDVGKQRLQESSAPTATFRRRNHPEIVAPWTRSGECKKADDKTEALIKPSDAGADNRSTRPDLWPASAVPGRRFAESGEPFGQVSKRMRKGKARGFQRFTRTALPGFASRRSTPPWPELPKFFHDCTQFQFFLPGFPGYACPLPLFHTNRGDL